MSDREITPWPAWVRYPLILALIGIGVTGLVLAVVNGVDGAVIRILVAAVVIPSLLLPLQLLGLRRRSARTAESVQRELTDLESRIRDELSIPAPQRASGASDADLTSAASWIDLTRRQVRDGAAGEGAASVEQLRRSTSGWAADAPLTMAVERCARSSRTWSKIAADLARRER